MKSDERCKEWRDSRVNSEGTSMVSGWNLLGVTVLCLGHLVTTLR